MVSRIENSEPISFDLRQGDDELEDQGIRAIHFYIGDDDDDDPEFQEVEEIDISDDEAMVRRLGKRMRMWPSLLTVELMKRTARLEAY